MEEIKLTIQSETEGSVEKTNAVGVAMKIVDILYKKQVTEMTVNYKEEPVHCECTSPEN